MNYLDWFFVFILGSGLIWGYRKGFVRAVVGFLAIGLAIWAGISFSGITESILRNSESIPQELTYILSLLITIVLIYFAVKLAGKILHGLTHTIGLGIFNRLGGALFGVLLNVLTLSALIYYVLPIFSNLFATETLSQSQILPYLKQVIDLLKTNFQLLADSSK